MSPEEAAPTPAQRSASTARRERRDRCSYLAGERAGRIAGLKEAAEIAAGRPHFVQDLDEVQAAIRARIAEIEVGGK